MILYNFKSMIFIFEDVKRLFFYFMLDKTAVTVTFCVLAFLRPDAQQTNFKARNWKERAEPVSDNP